MTSLQILTKSFKLRMHCSGTEYQLCEPGCTWAVSNLATLVWCGPDDYQEDFRRRFYRKALLHGDVYLQASDDDVVEEFVSMAKNQGNFFTHDAIRAMSGSERIRQCLPPGVSVRLRELTETSEAKAIIASGHAFMVTWTTTQVIAAKVTWLCRFF